jgi:hypothetical protein
MEGMKDTVDVLYSIIRTRQYALQQIGHGEYSKFNPPEASSNWNNVNRFRLPVGSYVRDQLFQFPTYRQLIIVLVFQIMIIQVRLIIE